MAKILVAEDELVTRTIIVRALEKDGHHIIAASTGDLAWKILTDNPGVNLVITDYMMPEMDGRALVKAIRENDEYAEVPVIMTSGVIGLNEISQVLSEGVNRFLPKPVNVGELREYVQALLGGDGEVRMSEG